MVWDAVEVDVSGAERGAGGGIVGMFSSVGEAGAVVRMLPALYGLSVRSPRPVLRFASILLVPASEYGQRELDTPATALRANACGESQASVLRVRMFVVCPVTWDCRMEAASTACRRGESLATRRSAFLCRNTAAQTALGRGNASRSSVVQGRS